MSRRKRTSWAPPLRSTTVTVVEGLCQLDAVAVRVEDVHEPDLPVQLEDDTDLDARCAQALGLRLHVDDVDVRDAARLGRVAHGERDLHPAVLEPRPARRRSRRTSPRSRAVAVEGPARVEVARRGTRLLPSE